MGRDDDRSDVQDVGSENGGRFFRSGAEAGCVAGEWNDWNGLDYRKDGGDEDGCGGCAT